MRPEDPPHPSQMREDDEGALNVRNSGVSEMIRLRSPRQIKLRVVGTGEPGLEKDSREKGLSDNKRLAEAIPKFPNGWP